MTIIEECKRYNDNKAKWSLIDFNSMTFLVKVMEMGIGKYGYNNWKKGRSFTETWESLFRHVMTWKETEDLDKESGINHIGHAMANLMFLAHMTDNKPYFDDREFAVYPRTARESTNAIFSEWKTSVIINCRLYNPLLYSRFLNKDVPANSSECAELILNGCFKEDKTPFEAIEEMQKIK